MRITATPNAVAVIERSKAARAGTLTVTIGTGCCESTAPFLYEDFWPGPDQEPIGEVAGVVVYAPDYLRELYPGDQAVVLDAHDELAESMSIETEYGTRLILRGAGFDSTGAPEVCAVPEAKEKTAGVLRPVVGTMPPELRKLRMR
jgi:uncharacterized protein (DUF779 family)